MIIPNPAIRYVAVHKYNSLTVSLIVVRELKLLLYFV